MGRSGHRDPRRLRLRFAGRVASNKATIPCLSCTCASSALRLTIPPQSLLRNRSPSKTNPSPKFRFAKHGDSKFAIGDWAARTRETGEKPWLSQSPISGGANKARKHASLLEVAEKVSTARTGWLPKKDSNFQMKCRSLAFEMSAETRVKIANRALGDFCGSFRRFWR